MIGQTGCQSSDQQTEVTGGGQVPSSRTGGAEGRVGVSGSIAGGSGAFVFIFHDLERTSGLVSCSYRIGRLGQLFLRWPYYNLASRTHVSYVTFCDHFIFNSQAVAMATGNSLSPGMQVPFRTWVLNRSLDNGEKSNRQSLWEIKMTW